MLPNILTQAQLSFCKVSDKKPNNNEYKGLYQGPPEIFGIQNRVKSSRWLSCNYSLHIKVRQCCGKNELGRRSEGKMKKLEKMVFWNSFCCCYWCLYPRVFKGKHSVPFWHFLPAYYKYLSWAKDCILMDLQFWKFSKMTSFLKNYLTSWFCCGSMLKHSKIEEKSSKATSDILYFF